MTKVKGVLKKDGKELTALRKCVETQIGHSIKNSSDFAELSDTIQNEIREYVSVNTLKRIWNYINTVMCQATPHYLSFHAMWALTIGNRFSPISTAPPLRRSLSAMAFVAICSTRTTVWK